MPVSIGGDIRKGLETRFFIKIDGYGGLGVKEVPPVYTIIELKALSSGYRFLQTTRSSKGHGPTAKKDKAATVREVDLR